MLDIEKQIDYWKSSAFDDLETAKVLIDKNRLLHGLFFCHLVIEKIIKAHVVKQTKNIAPRSHNLMNLSEISKLVFNENEEVFLGILMKYQLEGRYPDYNPTVPDLLKVTEYLKQTEKLLQWLEAKL
jgi:HEPN domain-containing protein